MARNYEKLKAISKLVNLNGVERTASMLGMKESSVERRVRDYRKASGEPESISGQVDASPVLMIPDLHAPYQHPQAIEFLKWVYELRGCGRVVSPGDLYDFHSMSRFISETDAMNAKLEYAKAKEFVRELVDVFPEGDIVLGNHDLIPQRQMKELGLLSSMLKDNNELYGLPKGWTVHNLYHVIEPFDVLVEHGIGSAGKYGCANTAKEKRCSYVQGHTHSAAAVIYSTNHNSTIFGMNVGCLVDSASLAMRYGKYGTKKGVLGCGVVYSGSHAEFVPIQSWPGYKGGA